MISLCSVVLAWERFRDRPKLGGPGIDVSHHQGSIDWLAAYADLADDAEDDAAPWVYVKATEGVGYTDPRFYANVLGARGAGFDVGAYHFARLDSGVNAQDDAQAEVDAFLEAVDRTSCNLRPCLDIELGGIKRRDPRWCRDWISVAIGRVRNATELLPVIYTGYWTMRWVYRGGDPLGQARMCPLWQAEYTNGKRPRKKIPGWEPLIWQHTSKGRVEGVPGRVDRNVVLGTDSEFGKLRTASNEVA